MTIRGLWTHAGALYSVEDQTLYSIDSVNLKTSLGSLNSLSGVVDFASNLTQLVINDGSYLYVYTPSTKTLIPATGYLGGDRISFLNQRVNAIARGTQQFTWTGVGNASSFDGLDFASAEGSPDVLISQLAFNNELVLFGQESTEIWDPSDSDAVYAKTSAAIDYGCIAPHSAQKTANSAFWLSQDKQGQAMVLSLQGHQAKRISQRSEEEKFEGKELSGARAFTFSDGPHSFYCLNVPGVDTTLVWDETFQQWHERAEWNGVYSQWRPTCHAFAYGKHFFGAGASLYRLDSAVNNYGGSVKRRQRIAPVVSSPTMGRVKYGSLEILCEKGTGATVMLRFSDDNGANWSNWQYTTVGAAGQFARRARFRRLGMAYDRVFDVVMTDDKPFNPVAVNIPLR